METRVCQLASWAHSPRLPDHRFRKDCDQDSVLPELPATDGEMLASLVDDIENVMAGGPSRRHISGSSTSPRLVTPAPP